MIEALVGVLFAAFFVTFYYVISLLRRGRERDGSRWPELYPPALPGANPVESKTKLFKTTEEMSRHQLPARSSSKPSSSSTMNPAAGQRPQERRANGEQG